MKARSSGLTTVILSMLLVFIIYWWKTVLCYVGLCVQIIILLIRFSWQDLNKRWFCLHLIRIRGEIFLFLILVLIIDIRIIIFNNNNQILLLKLLVLVSGTFSLLILLLRKFLPDSFLILINLINKLLFSLFGPHLLLWGKEFWRMTLFLAVLYFLNLTKIF